MRQSPRALSLALSLVLAACEGGSPPSDDGGTTDARPPACEAMRERFEGGDADGHPSPLGAAEGEARAGRLAASALPADRLGLATWRAGDYVLANDSVAAIVTADRAAEIYDPYGGRVVGLARVEGGALVDAADFGIVLLGLGRFVVATESVSVLASGEGGGDAVVRAEGRLVPIEALGSILDGLFAADYTGLPAALDYRLAPGSDAIEVSLSVRSARLPLRTPLALSAFFQSYRMQPWSAVSGFVPLASGDTRARYVIFEDPEAASYAWLAAAEALSPVFSTGGFDIYSANQETIAACGEGEIALGSFVVGGRGLPGAQRAVGRVLGEARRDVSGVVVESDGTTPALGVRVHATDAAGAHLGRVLVDEAGRFALSVPMAATGVSLHAWREGDPLVGPVAESGATTITMPASATLRVVVTEAETMRPLPSRVHASPRGMAPPSAPEAFGERGPGGGRTALAFPTDGVAELRLPPGTYEVIARHGWAHERAVREVTLAEGERAELALELPRAFETPGVLCADYHIHTHRSVDSSDDARLKVAALVADGLSIAIRSEHEWVSDFAPVIDALGLSEWALGLAGEELTTFTYGHFGVFPLTPDASRASGGAVVWYDRLAPDVFDEVRTRGELPALIINHPRGGGIRQAYFDEAGFDPTTGTIEHPELWDEDFDVVEVFNGSDFERNREGTVADWMALLRSGRRVVAVGSSDSHAIVDDPVGYPRTCLAVGADDPRMIDGEDVRDATRAGASFVTGGIYLEARVGTVGPGGTATGVGPRASIEVVVRAASFVDVDRLEVIVDGETTETIAIGPEDADPMDPTVRLRATLEADVAASGSFVVLHAAGDLPTDPAHTGRLPFAVTNPIWLAR